MKRSKARRLDKLKTAIQQPIKLRDVIEVRKSKIVNDIEELFKDIDQLTDQAEDLVEKVKFEKQIMKLENERAALEQQLEKAKDKLNAHVVQKNDVTLPPPVSANTAFNMIQRLPFMSHNIENNTSSALPLLACAIAVLGILKYACKVRSVRTLGSSVLQSISAIPGLFAKNYSDLERKEAQEMKLLRDLEKKHSSP